MRNKELEWQDLLREAERRCQKASTSAKTAQATPDASDEEGLTSSPPVLTQMGDLVTDHAAQITKAIVCVGEVATKSKNLKGTFVKSLKDSGTAIVMVTEALAQRTSNEEILKLGATNKRLKAEVNDLRQEIVALREQMTTRTGVERGRTPVSNSAPHPQMEDLSQTTASQTRRGEGSPNRGRRSLRPRVPDKPPWLDDFARSIMVQVRTMVNARLEALEERLPPKRSFRPPLNVKPSGGRDRTATTPAPAPRSRAKGGRGAAVIKEGQWRGGAGCRVQTASGPWTLGTHPT